MAILLTNDDGVDAPGLAALAAALDGGHRKIVVAPREEQSGCGHATTTNRPIRLTQLAADRFQIDALPADCVRVAFHQFPREIDWVLAGINSGGNLGSDVYQSGTVAAVREAVLHGVPGIAVSHYRNRTLSDEDWRRAVSWVSPLLARLMREDWEPGTFWNINLPCLPPGDPAPQIVYCPTDISALPVSYEDQAGELHYQGNYHGRSRAEGSDVDVCFSGKIAISRLHLATK